MGLISILWGIVAMIWMVLALIPLVGITNWLLIPFAAIGAILAAIGIAVSSAGKRGRAKTGLVLNCVVLWNTVYCNRALDQLRDQGYPVLDTDAERLSAFIRDHIGIDGHYAFHLPDLGGTHRPLRDPDSSDDD